MDEDGVWMGALAVVMALTTFLSWRQRDERRDVVFLGVTTAGLAAGTALMWVF